MISISKLIKALEVLQKEGIEYVDSIKAESTSCTLPVWMSVKGKDYTFNIPAEGNQMGEPTLTKYTRKIFQL